MKNIINFYYNLNPTNIYKKNDYYYFNHNNELYIIKQYKNNIKEINNIYILNQQMLYQNIPVHQIIINKNNYPLSTLNNTNYILYKIYIKNIDKKITLNDISKLNNIYIEQQNLNIDWSNNWINRIDYIEYQINQTGKKYPNLVESLSYYIGLSENAITYIKSTLKDNNNNNEYSYSHRKLTPNSCLFDLYDPCNITIDYKVKDIAEYIKISFYTNNFNIIEELNNYFKNNYLTLYSIKLLYGRTLYPSIYYQMYDDIIQEKINQKEITTITSLTNKYQNYLYEIYLYLKKFYSIPEVEWLKKNKKVV